MTDVSASTKSLAVMQSLLLLSKSNKIFFGCFDPENIFLGNEND